MGSATSSFRPMSIGALARFGLLALVPVVALGAVLAYQLNVDVQQRYLDSSRTSATLITQVGVQPLLDAQQLANGLTPTEVSTIDQKLQGAAVSQEVRRIKVWNRAGTIVYSDNHNLIGRTFSIDSDLAEALAGDSSASITSGHDEENQGDDLAGPLVQVYVPLIFKGSSAASGAFELYLPYAPVQAAIDHETRQLYGVLAIGLVLFYAAMFPVFLLADRWRRQLQQQAETTAMANLAVLERLNKLKSEFLTRISHQFRTALVGIKGFSEVIRDSEDLDIEKVKAFAGDIFNDAERLDRAFTEMLELDRMEAGHSLLEIANVDINQLIADAVATARRENPRHVIAAVVDASLPAISVDREKVAQVLTILLSNATRYSPPGSEVAVTSEVDGLFAKITVKDQGPGMPRDFDNGLFVTAERQQPTGNGQTGVGITGLGLAIAREIVEIHGGRIWFDSKAGKGTEFHFTLPLHARAPRQEAPAEKAPVAG